MNDCSRSEFQSDAPPLRCTLSQSTPEVLIEMKRLGVLFSAVLVASLISGCGDEGIKEGMSTEPGLPNGQPPGFKEQMERDAKNMQLKGKTGPPPEAKKAAAAAAASAKEAEKPSP